MSLVTPKISDINDNIIAQLETSLNQSIPLLPKAFSRVLVKTLAGVFIVLYKYAGFIFQQMFIATATLEETEINGRIVRPLVEHGIREGAGSPVPGVSAELTVTVSVSVASGSLTPGTLLRSNANGVTYSVINSVALATPSVPVKVKAVSDTTGGGGIGSIGNLVAGDKVSFVNPVPNVEREAVVASVDVTGADAESAEDYRRRILNLTQKRPQGGAYADYQHWGLEVAGIINVYPYTGASPGEVDIYSEATTASSGSADGIPTGSQLNAVKTSCEVDSAGVANRKPVSSFINSYAITRTSFKCTITGLVADNLVDTQTAVTTALTDLFLSFEPFIDGLTVLPARNLIDKNVLIGTVNDVVSSASGGSFSTLTFELSSGGGPISSYTLGSGEKAKAGAVVFA